MNRVIEMVPWSRRVRGLVALSVALGLGGCDTAELLEVDLPGNVTASDIEDPGLAATMRVSAIGDFEWAWDEYVDFAAKHSDEYIQSSGNFTGRRLQLRDIPANLPRYQVNVFGRLHRARVMLESNFDRLQTFSDADVPNRTQYLAEMRAYGGFIYVVFGEGFCGTPLNGDGVVRTSDQLLEIAVDQFTEALSIAGALGTGRSQELVQAARIGRARAYLDLQQYPNAIADAQSIVDDTGLDFYATREYGENRRENSMANTNELDTNQQSTVAPSYRDLQWKGVADPRVTVMETGLIGHDNATIVWRHNKTPESFAAGAAQDVIIASSREARMIIAEASAMAGDLATAIGILNDFHTAAGIPPVTAEDLPTQDDVIRHVIEERRREFFVEGGHRHRDHLRWRGTPFNIPYLGEAGSDHPNGVDQYGQVYGTTTCFPVAQNEQVGG
jgi:hypothetical protein